MKLVLYERIVKKPSGECPKNRFTLTDEGEPGLNYLGIGYRMYFSHTRESTEFMAEELLAGRAPTNVLRRNN